MKKNAHGQKLRLHQTGYCSVLFRQISEKTIQAGELFYPEHLAGHLEGLLEWKNLILTRVYGAKPYLLKQIWDYLRVYGEKLKPLSGDTGDWLRKAQSEGKRIPLKRSWAP